MKYSLFLAGLCFAMLGCQQSPSPENEKEQSAAGSTTSFSGSSSAAVENKKDTAHTFIRTADLKFKVNNVEKVTYKIEDITFRHGGYVTSTQLNSVIDNVLVTAVSADSSVETTRFTVTNTLMIRVPNIKLDTTLKDIAGLVDYLDYRIIKADDISLQMHANNLAQKRGNRHAERLMQAIDNQGRKLGETTAAEEQLQHKQVQADDALLSNMAINDQVNYSTVQLSLYQRQAVKNELIANTKNVAAYEPGFGTKLSDALIYGLRLVESIFLLLLHLWPLFLVILIGIPLYKKYGYRRSMIRGTANK